MASSLELETEVLAWRRDGHTFERYAYPRGPAGAAELHAHEDYQICLSEDFPGEYRYRGGRIAVPVGSVSVIHPGEPHAVRDPIDRDIVSHYRMFYFASADMARMLGLRERSEPFFAEAVRVEPTVFEALRIAHLAAERRWPRLEREHLLAQALKAVAATMGGVARRVPAVAGPVAQVRDRIHAGLAEDLSLRELAEFAGMSEGHLSRSFKAAYGMPPHAYQLAIRIERARGMLQAGIPPSVVADALGFTDQAHFTRRFKRTVGVSPGRYQRIA